MTLVSRRLTTGQACVRIIEAVDVLLVRQQAWLEQLLLRLVRSLCSRRLCRLIMDLLTGVAEEILRSTERVKDVAMTVEVNKS